MELKIKRCKVKMLLQLSLLLNVFFILAAVFCCYKKRATIRALILKYFTSSKVSEKDLKNFNIEPYEIKNDTIQVNNTEGGADTKSSVFRKLHFTYRCNSRRAG